MSLTCQVGPCTSRATSTIHACGVVYACDPCRAVIDRLALSDQDDE